MRKIIHIDMDCFYAAVEMRDNPSYKNIPIAVGYDGPRSVVCTCNYIAREFGVRAAMPISQAKQRCPDITIVNARMAVYQQVSAHIREIFSRYTNKIEPLSLDEAYLDVSESEHCFGSATLIAEEIRQAIFDELSLTASAGVAPNKFIAKIASDENKPNGICVVSPADINAFVDVLPLKKIPGIGPKTAERLTKLGFETCKDIRHSTVEKLVPVLGKNAANIYLRSFGEDHREVVTHRERKSLGVERTFLQDIGNVDECEKIIEHLFITLLSRYDKHKNKVINKQGIKLKFADFNQTTVEMQSHEPDIANFKALFKQAFSRAKGREIRLIGLSLGFKAPSKEAALQLSLALTD